MTTFAALLLTALTFAFVVYPFFKRRPSTLSFIEDEREQELHLKRDTAYSMLKEMEFDFQSGILTEEDYHELEARYKEKAISILKALDSLKEDDRVEDEIEKQVKKLRRSQGHFCPQCGTKQPAGARFCAQCGASLKPKEVS